MIDKTNSISFPSGVEDLFNYLFKKDYYVTLVGGAVRDFHLNEALSHDLDFELRHNNYYDGDAWKNKISELKNEIRNDLQLEIKELPFSILRISIDDYSVELSSPRLEDYTKSLGLGHSDFNTSFMSKLEYEKSFSRRDFTINAMGVEIKKDGRTFIDPFGGLQDLKSKNLRGCGQDFFKDPVRFLRLIRFSLRFNFPINKSFEMKLIEFNLKDLSLFYFFSESEKVGIIRFSKIFFNLVNKYSIQLNPKVLELEFLGSCKSIDSNKLLKSKLSVLEHLVLVEDCSLDLIQTYTKHASLKNKKQVELLKVRELLKFFEKFSLKILLNKIQNSTTEEVVSDESFYKLFQLKQLIKDRTEYLENISVESETIDILSLETLGNEDLLKYLSDKKVQSKVRKSLVIYFHLKSCFSLP